MPASAAEREKRRVKPGKRERGEEEKIVFTSHERNQLKVKSFVSAHVAPAAPIQ